MPLVVLAGCGLPGTSTPSPVGYQWTGAPIRPPLTKPSFTLTDDDNTPFNLRTDTAGKVTLLYFGYTNCPNICPENMAMVAFALKDVSAAVRAHIAVVFVTTDPARDTPIVLATWLGRFDAGLIGLTGTKAQVDVAQAVAQVTLASPVPTTTGIGYLVDHAAQIIAYTPDDIAHIEFFEGMPASGVARDLERLVTRGWSGD